MYLFNAETYALNPGDIIVGDDDGVVVIPLDKLSEVLKIANGIDETERQMTAELKKGTSIVATVKKSARI